VTLNDSLRSGLQIAAPNAAGDQNAFLNYLSSRPALAPLGAGVRNILTAPSARAAGLYAATTGQFPSNDRDILLSGRIDHTFNDSDTGFARLNFTRTSLNNQGIGGLNAVSRGRSLKAPTGGILLSETHTFNSTTVNEARAQFS